MDTDRLAAKITTTQLPKGSFRRRDDVRDSYRRDVFRSQIDDAQQLSQPDSVFITGAMSIAGTAPLTKLPFSIVDCKHPVGIAIIDHQQHASAPSERLRRWRCAFLLHLPFPAGGDRKSTRLNSSHVKI